MKNIILLISTSAFFFISCGNTKKEEINNEPAILVKVRSSTANSTGSTIIASGKIEAEKSANISTRIMGTVSKVHVKVGEIVSTGQLLISINNNDLQAKKAQTEASILQATAAYNSARKDYDRYTTLFAQQSASQKELEDITARYEMAKAVLEGARQQRNEVMAQLSYSNVTAPFSGEITNTFVKEGDMANPGMPLVSIEGPNNLQVVALVSESDIISIKNGINAKVIVKSTNQLLTGKVVEVSSSAKNTGGQYMVKVDLDNIKNKVLSGMFVNVQFLLDSNTSLTNKTNDMVLVPQTALVYQGQLIGIYTISNNNLAILRWIRTGKIVGNQVEVLSGISANEQYIISADGKLYNGAKISVQ